MKIVLLAAGLSSRMENVNKLLLEYNGKTILEHAIENVLSLNIPSYIILGHENDKTTKIAKKYNINIIYNEDYMNGQETSLIKAYKTIDDDILFTLSDMPMLKKDDLLYFINQIKDSKAIRPYFNNVMGNPVYISRETAKLILKEGKKTKTYVLDKAIGSIVNIQDIDTKQEYDELIKGNPV